MAERDQARAPRNLILCSDGTGNRAGRANGTNVWPLHEAINRRAADGEATQLATHDDGVGTSNYQWLKIMGGDFGYGLKANVLQLYAWLAQNYRPGDRIYVFGFSRGAFTVRLLAGLIARCGIPAQAGPENKTLHSRAKQAWNIYKRTQAIDGDCTAPKASSKPTGQARSRTALIRMCRPTSSALGTRSMRTGLRSTKPKRLSRGFPAF